MKREMKSIMVSSLWKQKEYEGRGQNIRIMVHQKQEFKKIWNSENTNSFMCLCRWRHARTTNFRVSLLPHYTRHWSVFLEPRGFFPVLMNTHTHTHCTPRHTKVSAVHTHSTLSNTTRTTNTAEQTPIQPERLTITNCVTWLLSALFHFLQLTATLLQLVDLAASTMSGQSAKLLQVLPEGLPNYTGPWCPFYCPATKVLT
jgi:hypothetical protein